MTDETTITKKSAKKSVPVPGSSTLFNVSVRAWIAMMLVGTACFMALMAMEIKEPLYSALMIVLGAMFNQALNHVQKTR